MKGAAAIKRSGAYFRGRLLVVALGCALLDAGLTVFVVTNPRPAVDAWVARAVQSIDAGPMSPVLDFYRQIGGPYALEAEAVVFAIILTINRASWRLLISGSLVSGWYFLLVRLISRPRPAVPDVLRVTEHPGASSYPSGHMILFVFYAVILMTCLGLKFVPRRWQPLGWGIAALFVIVGGFSRIYSGAHWPTDVLGGILIAVAWLSFVMSIRWISAPVLEQAPRSTAEKAVRPAA